MEVTRIVINRQEDKIENGFFIIDENETVTAVDYDTANKMLYNAIGRLDCLIANWRQYNPDCSGDFIVFVRG